MNGLINIAMGDPAGTMQYVNDPNVFDIRNDPFGIVGIQANLQRHKIKIKLAKQFRKCNFSDVARYFQLLKNKVNPNFMGLETNNRGAEILKHLNGTPYNLGLKGVSTSSDLSFETLEQGYSMDKNLMIHWFQEQKRVHNILFENNPKGDMVELETQISEIHGFTGPSGNTTFRRKRGRHDDLFMALLLCCHIAIVYMRRYDQLK